MDDLQRLQEHALARQRLLGSYLRGSGWRQRMEPNPVRRLIAGVIIAVVACIGVAAASFASDQLSKQRALRAAGMSCTPQQPTAPGRVRSMPLTTLSLASTGIVNVGEVAQALIGFPATE